jgi:hypothetical protein
MVHSREMGIQKEAIWLAKEKKRKKQQRLS